MDLFSLESWGGGGNSEKLEKNKVFLPYKGEIRS